MPVGTTPASQQTLVVTLNASEALGLANDVHTNEILSITQGLQAERAGIKVRQMNRHSQVSQPSLYLATKYHHPLPVSRVGG